MEQKKIDRINELAKKAKAQGLTPEEEKERALLRTEYVKAYRESLRRQLESAYVLDENGNERPLQKKDHKMK